MYEVYVDSCGHSNRVTDASVDIVGAYQAIEDSHADAAESFKKILDAWCMRGIHDDVAKVLNDGQDYSIVSALTGEVVRKVHCNF